MEHVFYQGCEFSTFVFPEDIIRNLNGTIFPGFSASKTSIIIILFYRRYIILALILPKFSLSIRNKCAYLLESSETKWFIPQNSRLTIILLAPSPGVSCRKVIIVFASLLQTRVGYKQQALSIYFSSYLYDTYIHANPTDLRGSLPNFKVFYRLPILDVFLPI